MSYRARIGGLEVDALLLADTEDSIGVTEHAIEAGTRVTVRRQARRLRLEVRHGLAPGGDDAAEVPRWEATYQALRALLGQVISVELPAERVDNLVMESCSRPHAETQLRCTIALREVRIVELRRQRVPRPALPRARRVVAQGRQASRPATPAEQAAAGNKAGVDRPESGLHRLARSFGAFEPRAN